MDPLTFLLENYYARLNDELLIAGISASALARQYGTPLFIYDAGIIAKKWALVREALPPRFSVYYSMKANPNRTILRFFLSRGAGVEISSAGEFCQAISAGCGAEKILFAGPGKTEAELELVLARDIGEIHVESLREAERIATIAGRLGIRARVGLRVNPSGDGEGGAMRMGGGPAPFGVDEEILDDVLGRILALPALDFRGIHFYEGTQILDFRILAAQFAKGIEIARRVAARLKKPLDTLDLGGGFGIPYFAHEQPLNTRSLREALDALTKTVENDPLFSGTHFLTEPGRYLVGEAGVYIARVTDVKVSRGKKFLVLDGGMNHHLAASGNLGQTIKRNYPLALVNKLGQPAEETVDVVGPLCTPLDVLGRGVNLPRAEAGDLAGVFQSGAYARSASPLGFLSHPSPPEVWVEGGAHRLIRRRGNSEDYLRDQCFDAGAG
ncbi:MAG: type III PLP-dependent enzyme [Candidatus Acidiferrales bacterium]